MLDFYINNIRGDANNLMIRGDLFRLEKDFIAKMSKINNTYCNNFKFKMFFYVRAWCLDPEKRYILKKNFVLEYEWQHTTSFLAKSLNYEVNFSCGFQYFDSFLLKSWMN